MLIFAKFDIDLNFEDCSDTLNRKKSEIRLLQTQQGPIFAAFCNRKTSCAMYFSAALRKPKSNVPVSISWVV